MDKWKSIVGYTILVLSSAFGFYAWASEEIEQRVLVVEAKQQILHDRSYQNSRIARKQDQIKENERELEDVLSKLDLTDRDLIKIEKLDNRIEELEEDIEDIEVELAQSE